MKDTCLECGSVLDDYAAEKRGILEITTCPYCNKVNIVLTPKKALTSLTELADIFKNYKNFALTKIDFKE